MESDKKKITIWLVSICFFVLLIVAVGGITRLTRSGLSIVEWKPVTGIIPPLSESDWIDSFSKYKQTPQYLNINTGMRLSEYKKIYFWEFIHRILGRGVGIVFLLPFIYFIIRAKMPRGLQIRLWFILALGGSQGLLGWYMVKSGLISNPHVSHYRLAAHLSLAFYIFCYTGWVLLNLWKSEYSRTISVPKSLCILSRFALFGVGLQIIYGAFVAGLKAGFVYNTYPLMNGTFLPADFGGGLPFWSSLIESKAAVQFIHRWLGLAVAALVLALTYRVRLFIKNISPLDNYQVPFEPANPDKSVGVIVNLFVSLFNLRKINYAVVGLVGFQFLLGVLTLLWQVPITLAVMHQVVALLLLFSLVVLYHRLT